MPRETFQQELDGLVALVIELGTEVAASLKSAVEAMMGRDAKVDLLYSEALNLITNPPDEHGVAPEWRMRATQMVHYLERVSDHGVGIGASAVFLVTGERMGDATKQ
jgi:phosphate uptake regulator